MLIKLLRYQFAALLYLYALIFILSIRIITLGGRNNLRIGGKFIARLIPRASRIFAA